MNIYPAIDLLGGQCVRLTKGRFDQVTTYHADPVAHGQRIADQGSKYLHIVDLDGTKRGATHQTSLITKIVKQCGLKVQVGGGVRGAEDVKQLLDAGVDKVVIGSLAAKDEETTSQIIATFGAENITLAADIQINEMNEAVVATHGWQEASGLSLWDFLNRYCQGPTLPSILCTDINRDGMLGGPNLNLYRDILIRFPAVTLQASGGIGRLQDIKDLKQMGMPAVIVGKALYEERFSLEEALAC